MIQFKESDYNNFKRFTGFPSKLTDTDLMRICKRGKNLTHLNLQNCNKITDAGLNAIALNCKQLTHLNVKSCHKITDVGLMAILRNCKQLANLDSSKDYFGIPWKDLQAMYQNMEKIKFHNFNFLKDITYTLPKLNPLTYLPYNTNITLGKLEDLKDIALEYPNIKIDFNHASPPNG